MAIVQRIILGLVILLAPRLVSAQMRYPNGIWISPHGEIIVDAGWPGKDIAGIAVNGWAGSGDNIYSQVLEHSGPGRVAGRFDMQSSDPLNHALYLTQFSGAYSGNLIRIDTEDPRNYSGPGHEGTFTGNILWYGKRGVEKFRIDHEGNLYVRGVKVCCD